MKAIDNIKQLYNESPDIIKTGYKLVGIEALLCGASVAMKKKPISRVLLGAGLVTYGAAMHCFVKGATQVTKDCNESDFEDDNIFEIDHDQF